MAETEPTTKQPITDEVATTRKDVDIFTGWLNRLENPDPVLRTEAAGRGLKLYDEVDRDAHAGSVLQTRYLAVAGKEWDILPASDSEADQAIATFVKDAVENANFTLSAQELMQAALYGYWVSEVMWKATASGWIPERIMGKHPRRFSFTLERELRLLTPSNMIDGERVPDRKFIVFTWGSSDNPYGKGLGQKLWWPVWFKKNGIKFWWIFLEKFGSPTTVGKYPPGTPPEQQQTLLNAIDAIHQETGIKIPNTMAIELLEAVRQGSASYESACAYMDRQISKAVLGQTASTEGTPGKLGSEDAQDAVRDDLVKADSDLLCECLNGSLVRWIVDYNFAGVTDYPTLWIRTDPEQDLKPLAERDKILVADIGLPVSRQYFYDTYGIDAPEEGDEDVIAPATEAGKLYEYHLKYGIAQINEIRAKLGMPPISGGDRVPSPMEVPGGVSGMIPGGPAASGFAETQAMLSDQAALDAMIDRAVTAAAPARDEISAALRDALESCESFEEMQVVLAESLADRESAKKLLTAVSEAMFNAELWGRYAANRK